MQSRSCLFHAKALVFTMFLASVATVFAQNYQILFSDNGSTTITDSSSNLADGYTVKLGVFSGNSSADISALAYNRSWINANFISFGDGMTDNGTIASPYQVDTSHAGKQIYAIVSESASLPIATQFALANGTNSGGTSGNFTYGNTWQVLSSIPSGGVDEFDNPILAVPLNSTSEIASFSYGAIGANSSISTANAATALYWNGANATGANATWSSDTSAPSQNWTISQDGTTYYAWGSTNGTALAGDGLTARFGGTASTVTVNGSVSAHSGLNFDADGYIITSGTIVLQGADATANAITVGGGYNATISSELAGVTGLTKSGNGTLILDGNNTYTGGTTINSGTLQLGANGTTGSIAGDLLIESNAQLSVNRSGTMTYSGNTTGNGSVSLTLGNGTLILTGNNQLAGGTTINSGTLQIGNDGTTGTLDGDLFIESAGKLSVRRSGMMNYSGNVTGDGQVELTLGNGTLNFSGTSSGNGAVTIVSGTMATTGANKISAASAYTVNTNGTLAIGGDETIGSIAGAGNFSIADYMLTTGGDNSNTTVSGRITGNVSSGLTKQGNGTLTISGNASVGSTIIQSGSMNVTTGGRLNTLNNADDFRVGYNGNGTFNLSGGNVTSQDLAVGYNGTGTVNVTAGSLTVSNAVSIGDGGTGSLNLTGGNVNFNNGLYVGDGQDLSSGEGLVTVAGGNLTVNAELGLGYAGNGTLDITGGRVSSNSTIVGYDGYGLVTVSGGNLTASNDLTVGYNGNGTLNITGNGAVTVGGNVTLANSSNSTGTLNLGNGTTAGTLTAANVIAGNGTAVVNFNQSGNYTFNPALSGNLSVNQIGNGTTTLTGNNTYTGGTTIFSGTLQVGNGSTTGSIAGNVQTEENTVLAFNRSNAISYEGDISGNGTLLKKGNGTLTLSGNSSIGGTEIQSGTVNVTNGTFYNSGDVAVGSNGTGTLNITDGLATSNDLAVGYNGNGTLNMVGGSFTSNGLAVGYNGSGTLNITGGNFTNTTAAIGGSMGSVGNGIVNMSGGVWTPITYLAVGYNGTGTLNLTNGTLSTNGSAIGDNGSTGTVNVSGGSWAINVDDLLIGGSGNGTLNISGGNVTNINSSIGRHVGSNGTVNVSGGSWETGINLWVGYNGTGSLNITGNGVVSVGGNLTLAVETGSSGTLNIGNGSTAGTLQMQTGNVFGGDGAALVNFNHTGNYTFIPNLTGNLSVNKWGTGTSILLGNNTYTGGTTINSGTLQIGDGATEGSIAGNVSIAGTSSSLAFNRSDAMTFGGEISGNGTLLKNGAGTLTLTGDNTYTGATTINAGTLEIFGAGLLGNGTYAGPILNNGAFVFNSSSNQTLSGDISGMGSLTQNGTGTLIFTGLNNSTGVTTINFGTLQLGDGGLTGGIVGDLNISENGTFLVNRMGNFTYAGNATSNGSVIMTLENGTATLSGILSGTGSLTKNGNGTLAITGNNTASGNTTINAGVVNIRHANALGSTGNGTIVASGAALELQGGITVGAEELSLNGTGVSGGGALRNVSGNNTYGGNITLAGDTTINSNANVLTLSGGISGASQNLTVGGAGNTDINGAIETGTGTLTKNGNGTLRLTGNNTYTGATTISSGTLALLGNGTIGTGAFSISGGRLDMGGKSLTNELGGFTGGTLTNGTLTNDGSNFDLQSGVVSANLAGTNGVNKTTNGTLTLSGTNTYTGNTTISNGTLTVSGGNAIADSGALSVASGAVFNLGGNETVGSIEGAGNVTLGSYTLTAGGNNASTTIDGSISGAGHLTKAGTGTLTLTENNTYTGATTISEGVVYIQSGNALGGTGNGTTVASGAALELEGGIAVGVEALTLNGTGVSGGGALRSVSGTNTYGGNITLAGAATINADANLLTLSGGISGASQNLTIGGEGNTTVGGAIATTNGTLTKNGNGTLTLTGDNTYTGNTIINSGTLQLGNGISGGSMDSQNYIINGVLVYNYTGNNDSFSGNASGGGAFIRNGSGNLRLGSDLAFNGGTTLNSGTTYAESARALGNGSVTLTNNATLGIGAYAGPGFTSSSNLTLQVNGNFTWASENSIIELGEGAKLQIAGGLLNGGVSGNRTFKLNQMALGNYTLANFTSTNFTASDFLVNINDTNFTGGNFSIIGGNTLQYTITNNTFTVNSSALIDNLATGGAFELPSNYNGTITKDKEFESLTFNGTGSLNLTAGKTLTISSGNITVDTGTVTISNGTVETSGDFTKTGSGDLKVASNLIINGNATVDAGILSVNGNLTFSGGSGNLTVGANATLGGNGSVAGRVAIANNGILAPGNSPGIIDIENLDLSGLLRIDIESLSSFDRVTTNGTTITGTLELIPYPSPTTSFIPYGSYKIFTEGNITGNFSLITINGTANTGNLTTSVRQWFKNDRSRQSFVYSGTNGWVLVAPVSYTSVAVTQNQRNVAGALDSFITSTEVDKQTVSTALDRQTAEEYPTSFNQIAPGFYESLTNMAIEQAFNQNQLLNQRTSSVRLGIAGFQAMGGLSQPLLYDKDGKSAAQAKTGPIVQNAMATNWNAWVLGTGMFSRTTSIANVQNYNNNAGGFLLGADYRWNDNFVTGLYAGYDYSEAKYAGGSSTKGNSFNFGSYASYEQDGYYADAVVGGGFTTYETQRAIKFSTIDRKAKADPNSGQFTAGMNFGKDWKADKFTFGPVIGAHYTFANIGGFKESGADSLNLAIGQQDASSFRTTFGGRLAYNWDLNKKITLIPEVRLSWMHEFMNNPRNISSKLDGGNGSSFNYETTAPYRDSANAAIGVTAQFNKTISSSVFYNVNFGSQSYQSNTISVGLNFAF